MKRLIKALSGLGVVFVVLGLTSVSALAASVRPTEASMPAVHSYGVSSASGYHMTRVTRSIPSQCGQCLVHFHGHRLFRYSMH